MPCQRTKLEYTTTVWDPYLQNDINKLQSIQNKAARFVFNDYRLQQGFQCF